MTRRLSYLVLSFTLIMSTARSEWLSLKNGSSQPQPPHVTVLQDDRTGTVVKIDIEGIEVNPLVQGSTTYHSVDLLTDAFTAEVGFPGLPYVASILAVPEEAALSVEVVAVGEERSFPGYVVAPARRSWKEGDPEPPYVTRSDAYQSEEPYPSQKASVDPPGIFRDFRIARVAVYPVTFVASKKELRVASSITVRVKYGSGIVINPKLSPRKPIAPSFAALYRHTILNYQNVLDREYGGLETGRDVLLCIVPDAFASSLMPFAAWRHKTGTYVKVTKFSEIGANSSNPDIIKNYIAQVYHSWTYPPTYVLLGGGYGYVPIKQITYDYTIVSEDYFVEIDGNDFFPEAMIGRFTHTSDVVEQNIVNKIVSYERNPYTANTSWFKKGAVAANDAYPSAPATKRFARDRMMLDGGFTTVDTFINHSPCYSSLSNLIAVLTSGRSFLNYRGEGWYTGWAASCYNFQTSNVSSVNNGRMLTFVTSIGCGVAAFNQSSCFGEQWLELGTVVAPRGAVTFIGPTSNTHTFYNNAIDKGIYVGMFQEGLETPGQALARGRLYMYQVFGNEHWVEYQTRIYCILGDPTVHIWKDVPQPVTVTYPPSIAVGYNQVAVSVADSVTHMPVANAQVCLAGDSVYVTGYTGQDGVAILPVTTPTVDTLTILARGGHMIPSEGSIIAAAETEHVAPCGQPVVVDLDGNLDGKIDPNEHGQITFTLKNWGTQTASGVQAVLSADTNLVLIQTTSPVNFGDLPPGASQAGPPFQFFVKPTCAVGDAISFHAHVTSTDRTWDYLQPEVVNGCMLKHTSYIVDDRGSARANARMDPGETVRLYLTLQNVGNDVAPNVHGILRCASPFIRIIDSLGTFGTLQADSIVTGYSDCFIVKVDSLCPPRTIIPYSIVLQTQGGAYPYVGTDTLAIPVSLPQRSDPTGPDAYGYYAYASDDTLFLQAPHYSWVEINGSGTRVAVPAGGNYTTTVALPFTFRYYGMDYAQVRLSSDGWIAFGSGSQTAPTSACLPHNDNVNCMVAPLWDDLFSTPSDTGKLLYFSDLSHHRFIVEWYGVGHNNPHIGAQNRETFEIILFDPAHYPTTTGDGDILFQYKNMAYWVESSVGIENSTQTVALQYSCQDQVADESVTPLRDTLAILFTTRTPQPLTGVHEVREEGGAVPNTFVLEQNYPNPFNPQTTISYSLPVGGQVTLCVYSVTGQLVRTLFEGEQPSGRFSIAWDGLNDRRNSVGSGVYFYQLRVSPMTTGYNSIVQTKKLLLLR